MTLFREYPRILVDTFGWIIDPTWNFNLYWTETESANCLDVQVCKWIGGLWGLRRFVLNWLTECSRPQQYLTRDVMILHHQETGESHIFLKHQQPQIETTGLSRNLCINFFTLGYSKGQTEWSWDHELWVGCHSLRSAWGSACADPFKVGRKEKREGERDEEIQPPTVYRLANVLEQQSRQSLTAAPGQGSCCSALFWVPFWYNSMASHKVNPNVTEGRTNS